MMIDITGIILTPRNGGKDCLGDGEHIDTNGTPIECCCDECSYDLVCFPESIRQEAFQRHFNRRSANGRGGRAE